MIPFVASRGNRAGPQRDNHVIRKGKVMATAILDALQQGGAFIDDSQIVWLLTVKSEVVSGAKSQREHRPRHRTPSLK